MKSIILFLAANPSDQTKLALDEEARAIRAKIRAADCRDLLHFQTEWAVRPDDLLQYLNEYRPHVLHFSGHGSHSEELILQNDAGESRPVSKQALRALFGTLKDNIQLVVLNACYSRAQAEAIVEVIDCAVGMGKAISDEAAIVFAATFYRALGFGRSVKEAFDQGCAALLLEGIPEENTPELLVKVGMDAGQVVLVGLGAKASDAQTTIPPTEQTPGLEVRVRLTQTAESREHGTIVRKVVVELDLVGYSTILDNLEQGLDVSSAAQLNRQIQLFIDAGLDSVNAPRDQTVMATTGDGAILVFDSSQDAHRFAEAVQQATREHNRTRTQPIAKRIFRMGAATGEIVMEAKPGGGFDIAGGTIARAVRLESKAEPGGLLVDEATHASLSPEQQSRYGAKSRVAGKRDEEFEAYPCRLNPDGPKDAAFFTAHPRKETAPPIAETGFGRDRRREVLASFQRLKSHQYSQLIFLLEVPIGQRPPDTLNLDAKVEGVLRWAEENDRLEYLSEVLTELTEPRMHSAFRQELKRVPDDRLPIDERRSAAQRMADDFPPEVQSAFVDAIGRTYSPNLDPTVRYHLARAMGESGNPEAIAWLQSWVSESDNPLPQDAIREALQRLPLTRIESPPAQNPKPLVEPSRGVSMRLSNPHRKPPPVIETETGLSYASAVTAIALVGRAIKEGQQIPEDIIEKLRGLPGFRVDPDSFERKDGVEKAHSSVIFRMWLKTTGGQEKEVWARVGLDPKPAVSTIEDKLRRAIADVGGRGEKPPTDPPSGTTRSNKEGPGHGKAGVVQRITRDVLAMFGSSKSEAIETVVATTTHNKPLQTVTDPRDPQSEIKIIREEVTADGKVRIALIDKDGTEIRISMRKGTRVDFSL